MQRRNWMELICFTVLGCPSHKVTPYAIIELSWFREVCWPSNPWLMQFVAGAALKARGPEWWHHQNIDSSELLAACWDSDGLDCDGSWITIDADELAGSWTWVHVSESIGAVAPDPPWGLTLAFRAHCLDSDTLWSHRDILPWARRLRLHLSSWNFTRLGMDSMFSSLSRFRASGSLPNKVSMILVGGDLAGICRWLMRSQLSKFELEWDSDRVCAGLGSISTGLRTAKDGWEACGNGPHLCTALPHEFLFSGNMACSDSKRLPFSILSVPTRGAIWRASCNSCLT